MASDEALREMAPHMDESRAVLECPECEQDSILSPDPRRTDGRVQCFEPECGAVAIVQPCFKCGQDLAVLYDPEDDGVNFHSECIDYALSRD